MESSIWSLGMTKTDWIGRVAPVVFLILWASGFVVAKVALVYTDPFTLLALRYLIVVLVLAVPFAVIRPGLPRTRAQWVQLVSVGLLLQAGFFSCLYLALRFGLSAGAIALIASQQPILVALAAPYLAGERVSRVRWIGLGLGVLGACLVITLGGGAEAGSALGIVFGLCALVCMASSNLIEKRFGQDSGFIVSNLIQYGIALAVTAPLALWLEDLHVDWSGPFLWSLAYLVLGNSLLAISLLLMMLRRGEASRVTALFFLVPPATALLAFAVLGEPLTLGAVCGMGLAAAGIYLVMWRS